MKKVSMTNLRRVTIASLVVYILFYYFVLSVFSSWIDFSRTFSNILTLFGEGAGILIIVLGIRWQSVRHKKEWKLFAWGISMNLLGDFIWALYEILLKQEVPLPSIGDFFYFIGSIFYLLALIIYIRHEKLFDIVRTGFDIVITMVVSTTIIFNYVMIPIWNKENLTLLQKSVSLMYPILDIGYLGGVFSIFFFCMPKSKFNVSNLLTSIAFLIWFFVDLVYGILSGNTYVSGGILDPLWPIGCWVLALAILYPIDNEVAEYRKQDISSSRRELLWEYIRFLFPYFTVSIIVVLVSYQYILKDPLVTGTVITVLLIVIRQIFSLLENKRLISMIGKSNQLLEESKVELEERNTKLQELNYLKAREANTDFLTGIFNRRYVNEMLKSLPMINPNGKEVEVSVLLIDIDYYKQINDKWGHEVGDSVLKQIA